MINEYSSGRMVVNHTSYNTDLKIIRGQVRGNWWRKQGHRLDLDDIKDIISARPDILVVGTGYAESMRIPQVLRTALDSYGIQLIAENTHAAVETFNRLISDQTNIAGAFHLTC